MHCLLTRFKAYTAPKKVDRMAKEVKTTCIDVKRVAKMSHGWQNVQQRSTKLPQYFQMGMLLSAWSNRWTAHPMMSVKKNVLAMTHVSLRLLTKTGWRHVLSSMPGCSLASLNSQAASSLKSLYLLAPTLCVNDRDQQSTQRDAVQSTCSNTWNHVHVNIQYSDILVWFRAWKAGIKGKVHHAMMKKKLPGVLLWHWLVW